MAKFSRYSKLPRPEREELILEFCEALASIRNSKEAVRFVKDILTEQEIEMLAKRLRIARLLLEGDTYEEIQHKLSVSYGTVARVSEWLRISGEGYRMIVSRVEKREPAPKDYQEHEEMKRAYKRRFALYYWPELLIEDLAKRADRKQRENLREALRTVGEKTKLYRRLDKILREAWRES